ncbi:MAG: hypothetical protein NT157_04530 [Candidatus Micrarchaeota archaeon]|nr:hypothetical protein [Candidatus Micrarchaeota archaeon]
MPDNVLSWDARKIAEAFKIKDEDVRLYFTDGRRVSFIIERRLAYEVLNGTLAPSEGAGFDLFDSEGNKWEVRCITKGGVYFCPSNMVGKGRKFEERGFLDKLDEIKGYILADAESFPDMPFWIIPTEQVRAWYDAGTLGKNSKITRKKALELIDEMQNSQL